MNPFNLLINYIIASSRASYYNVSGNQEVTNTALLTGMISENPLLSYLIIDNKAKIEGENSASSTPVISVPVIHTVPALPPTGSTSPNPPKEEPKKDTTAPKEETTNGVALEAVKKEIEITNKTLADILVEFSGIKKKIESFDTNKIAVNESIAKIEKRLDEVAKANEKGNTKPAEPDVKQQPKTNPK